MNDGAIIIHGNSGDTTGYAMRSGEIYVQGNAGYRVGIHMKSYQDMFPTIVIGGKVGDFLGEYQAGGIIIVLGIGVEGCPVGHFCGTECTAARCLFAATLCRRDSPFRCAAQ